MHPLVGSNGRRRGKGHCAVDSSGFTPGSVFVYEKLRKIEKVRFASTTTCLDYNQESGIRMIGDRSFSLDGCTVVSIIPVKSRSTEFRGIASATNQKTGNEGQT